MLEVAWWGCAFWEGCRCSWLRPLLEDCSGSPLGGIFYFLASTSHRFQRGKGIEFPEGNPYECTVKPGEQLETPTVMTADKTKQLGNSTDFKRQNDHVSDFPMSVHGGSGLFFQMCIIGLQIIGFQHFKILQPTIRIAKQILSDSNKKVPEVRITKES